MARRLPRWDRLSLRNQLTLVNVALLALSLVIAGIGTTLLLRPTLVSQVDSSLLAIAADPSLIVGGDRITGAISYDDVRNAPQPYYVAVLDESGRLLVDNWSGKSRTIAPIVDEFELKAIPHPEKPNYDIVEVRDGLGSPWRTVALAEGQYKADRMSGTLVVAMPMSTVNATMASFLAIFTGFALSVLIFAAALTRLLVSITLQPLRQVESTAMAFAAGDYEQRLPEATPNTEVGRLSRSLNTMLGRIDSAFDDRERTIAQMRRFVGDASHELRTPLVTVRGYAELYRMGALDNDDKVGQAMDRIEGEAKRMAGLVEDLLQLARLDEHRELPKDFIDLEPIAMDAALDTRAQSPDRVVTVLPTRVILADDEGYDPQRSAFGEGETSDGFSALPEPLDGDAAEGSGAEPNGSAESADAAASANRAGSTLAPGRRRRGTRIRLTPSRRRRRTESEPALEAEASPEPTEVGLDEDVPAMIYGNSDKVRQAVQNIIGNALRYTPAGSPIEVGVVVDVPRLLATIEVIDHGDGVPEAQRKQIFQRFWRADTSRTRETGGSGLGLAIVSALMHVHEGRVDVVETPGGGATFRLQFPLLTAPPVENVPSTAAPNSDAPLAPSA